MRRNLKALAIWLIGIGVALALAWEAPAATAVGAGIVAFTVGTFLILWLVHADRSPEDRRPSLGAWSWRLWLIAGTSTLLCLFILATGKDGLSRLSIQLMALGGILGITLVATSSKPKKKDKKS